MLIIKIAILRINSISCGLQSSGFLSVIFKFFMNPSMLLNERDHPIIEKNDEINPNQPNKTVPVCKLKQKNLSRTKDEDDDGITEYFISPRVEF